MDRATVESVGLRFRSLSLWGSIRKAEIEKHVNAYLQAFAASGDCPKCGKDLGGIFDSFTAFATASMIAAEKSMPVLAAATGNQSQTVLI